MSIFLSKTLKIRGGWGLYPQTPLASGGWGLRSYTPGWDTPMPNPGCATEKKHLVLPPPEILGWLRHWLALWKLYTVFLKCCCRLNHLSFRAESVNCSLFLKNLETHLCNVTCKKNFIKSIENLSQHLSEQFIDYRYRFKKLRRFTVASTERKGRKHRTEGDLL